MKFADYLPADSWGLRLSGFIVSTCVCGAVALGTMQANAIWEPPPQAWGWVVVVLLAFSQFGAISCLAHRSKGEHRAKMLWGFVLFSVMTAIGVHRAWEEYRAPQWTAELARVNGETGAAAARAAERAPIEERRSAALDAKAAAAQALTTLGTNAQETFGNRTDSGRGAIDTALAQNDAIIADADAQLARLPPIEELPTQRPLDWFDGLAVLAALVIAGLEFIIWSSVHSEKREPRDIITQQTEEPAVRIRTRDEQPAPRRPRLVASNGAGARPDLPPPRF